MSIVRSGEVYAAWDGVGTLALGRTEDLDVDDCLAQMLLHEICHALVMGEGAEGRVDWGLPAEGDDVQERATQRLQAALADQYDVRFLFGVTTDHRGYWDALPADPLADSGDLTVVLARAALERLDAGPWSAPVRDALNATATIAAAVAGAAEPGSLWFRQSGAP
jgi:hypothetical protein